QPLSIADLRHEPAVRAEPIADVLVEPEPVGVFRIVLPAHVRRVAAQMLSGPLVGEIRTVRSPAGAVQPLTRDRVAPVRPPLEVRTGNAIVPVPVAAVHRVRALVQL